MQGRLPTEVRPLSYQLDLHVDPDQDRFTGRVRIDLTVERPVRSLTLHSLELDIKEARLAGRTIPADRIRSDAAAETVTLALEEPLPAGKAELEFEFSGLYNRQMRGLYLSTAKHGGKLERYAFTQLEATAARRMFPCFDEPEFKAKFGLSVTAPARMTVLSNQPPESRSVDGERQTVRFGESPVMSSYLLALAVARLVPGARKAGGRPVTVWTLPADKAQAGFALEIAKHSLKSLNRYFGLAYQLPKLDLVAVPDFAAGAMENWGAIFFRDSALLVDAKLSSTRARRRVAEVVAHEIVHQWFGNLVTMKWWDDLWLNEAFATWLAFKVVDEWKPAWKTWHDFEARKRRALIIDALRKTRPVISEARDTSEIEAQFDPLSYEKGGTFLRMIEAYLGEEAFRAGIQAYMREHQYGNTVAADLWSALEKASGEPVGALAQDWLTKPGYPMVAARVADAARRRLELSQKRFDAHGASQAAGNWTVPVVIRYRLKGESRTRLHRALLKHGREEIELPGKGELLWAYPNVGETGLYRVSLDSETLAKLRTEWPALDELERAGLLNHLWAQVKNGEASVSDFLDLAVAMSADKGRLLLEDMAGYLRRLETIVSDPDRPAFARLVESVFGPHWRRLGWKAKRGETDDAKLVRAAALAAFAAAPSARLAAEAEKKLKLFLDHPESLDPTLAPALLELGARRGPAARFDEYRRRMGEATTPERRDLFQSALAEFRDPVLARKLVELSLTDEIRGQDLWKPLSRVMGNTAVRGEAWKAVQERWAAIKEKTGPKGATYIIEGLASFADSAHLAGIADFFTKPENQVEASERPLAQTLETIELNIRFREAQSKRLSSWLNSAR